MKKALLCLVPAIILACQYHSSVLIGVGAIVFSVLSIYYIVSADKERSNKE